MKDVLLKFSGVMMASWLGLTKKESRVLGIHAVVFLSWMGRSDVGVPLK